MKKFFQKFKFAFEGLKIAFSEINFKIFSFIATIVIFLMVYLNVSFLERVILILVIVFTFSFELLNSQIERTLDLLQPNYDQRVKIIKDISAGAVFLVCLGAAIVGILIFGKYFVKLMSRFI